MIIENILNLNEYELASEINNVEMNDIINGYETRLATIAADYTRKFFRSKITALKQMQIVLEGYKEQADKLIEKFKYDCPAEVNRFTLKMLNIQYTYAGYVVGESAVYEAVKELGVSELLIKKSEYKVEGQTKEPEDKN